MRLDLRAPRIRIVSPPALLIVMAASWFATAIAVEVFSSRMETSLSLESPIHDRMGDVSLQQKIFGTTKLSPRQWRRKTENDDNNYNIYYYNNYYETYTGYIQPTGCISYTISLKDKGYDRLFPEFSVVGQESFFLFQYVLSEDDDDNAVTNDDVTSGYYDYDDGYEIQDDDDSNNNDDDGDGDDEDSDRYLSNAILAKDWMVIFSIGELSTGCIEMVDPVGVFRDVVPAIDDESLSFPTLYYGPICGGTAAAAKNSNETSAFEFEIGVFLDSNCNAYVPGLSEVLNEYVLSGLTTEVSLRGQSSGNGNYGGDNDDAEEFSPYYQIHYDLQNLKTFDTIMDKFNYYHNRESTNCNDHSEICEQITQASVDLDTCQPLADALLEVEEGDYDEHRNDEDEDDANNYGTISHRSESNANSRSNGSFGSFFQMYQWVVKNYASYTSSILDNSDNKSNGNNDSYKGFCYGVSKSRSMGYTLLEWLDANAEELRHELKRVYKIGRNNHWVYNICIIAGIVVASCGALLVLLEAFGCSIMEYLLPIKSCRAIVKRRQSLGSSTAASNDKSVLDDDTKCTSLLELSPSVMSAPSLVTSSSSDSSMSASSMSFSFSSPKRNYDETVHESIEVIFEGGKTSNAISGLKPPQ